MKTKELVQKYLSEARMMQVATDNHARPWICTVYYVEDEALNLFWLSLPNRRHSQDIANNSNIAIAIPIKHDKNPVIGIQAEGRAEVIKSKEIIEKIMGNYVAKYNVGQKFFENFVAGKNQHLLYKFTPKNIVLFDEVNFPDNSRQEISIN